MEFWSGVSLVCSATAFAFLRCFDGTRFLQSSRIRISFLYMQMYKDLHTYLKSNLAFVLQFATLLAKMLPQQQTQSV